MKIVSIGGGPAGLYFAILMKKQDPAHDITVVERNRPDDTFGWGVVFSDETLGGFETADKPSHDRIRKEFAYWPDIDTYIHGQCIRSTGHGFAGMSRKRMLNILQERCAELGVKLQFQREVRSVREFSGADLILAADGVNSTIREELKTHFQPEIDWRKCKFSWLGANFRLPAFTFIYEENEHGLFTVHAYPFEKDLSTFIVECREETWKRAGLDRADEAATIAYCEKLFGRHMGGHRLLANRSLWRTFPTIRNKTWVHDNVVLMGDAAHTAHFSIGSGTKLAMEDAIELARAFGDLKGRPVNAVLGEYEKRRRDEVARLQKTAQTSLEWYENVARYYKTQTPVQFTFNQLTRSKRITYDNLRLRDPAFVDRATQWFAENNPHKNATVAVPAYAGGTPSDTAGRQSAGAPPIFQPFALRGMTLANRLVVSPMCMYSCDDGLPTDWHLVHLGSRAIGGAGLVITEATHVSAAGRISPGCAGLYKPEHMVAWKRVVEFVHGHSRARIGIQLAHAGRKGSTDLPWLGGKPLAGVQAWETLAPSAIPYKDWHVPREMTAADMEQVRQQFVQSARWAEQAGFDMLELHYAHGYLMSTFISPLTNRRSDGYGGSLEARMRFPLEVFAAVRAVWPDHKPISVRLSCTEWHPQGLSDADRVQIGRMLKDAGCDIIDCSAGGVVPDQQPVYGRMFQAPFSDLIRNEAGIATMSVGNIQDADQGNTLLLSGRADLIVMARPHLSDPYLMLHAAEKYGVEDQYWPPQYLAVKPARRKG
ncbi:MAG: bifunctional salicylyl-CoA 5-hydroxylase/oxidoreductase [Planctomycetes bacterium]|jgi:anthraniloyl-CoA monooxygenase|nr:bifunctional salicylyl-CoA 5-hydroxylase/oxidoreductase [Planctomycetota bacterium]MCL4728919.1 bifunctional salicylyl-CoA 5-hydroxylase/oxidoreductase [Planctomycetota bacterium]